MGEIDGVPKDFKILADAKKKGITIAVWKERLKHGGVANVETYYNLIWQTFRDYGQYGFGWWEKKYHVVARDGKLDQLITFNFFRKFTEYILFFIEIKMELWASKEIETIVDGKKVKTFGVGMDSWYEFYMILDYNGSFTDDKKGSKDKFLRTLRDYYHRYFFGFEQDYDEKRKQNVFVEQWSKSATISDVDLTRVKGALKFATQNYWDIISNGMNRLRKFLGIPERSFTQPFDNKRNIIR